ncbi:MAG: hypothetical protein LBU62_05055 [Bacteroidales bacterium]|jgi:hypothetical protein|nr:hypothetical protein [Bacteroidales bacterium]
MVVDTKEEASTLWRTKIFVVAVFIGLVFAVVLVDWNTTLQMLLVGIFSLIFLGFYWHQYKMEYSYFYFSNNGKNLVFRFYSLRNLHGKPKSIEIAKLNFYKYDITTAFFDKKEYLILYQKTPKGIAKYPPISLTLLNRNQKTDLKRALFTAAISK